jgi:hypothetical protein
MELIPQDRDMEEDYPDLLYHYTDGAGLKGMLETGNIWATNVRFLNDTKEGELPFEEALEEFKRAYAEAPQMTPVMLQHLDEMAQVGGGLPMYLASFSSKADSLSQWRGYGGASQGYTIAFRRDELRDTAWAHGFELRECKYDDGDLRMYAETFVRGSLTDLGRFPRDVDEMRALAEKIHGQMSWFAAQYKHPAFKEEHEERVVQRILFDPSPPNIKFRVGARGLIPYKEVGLPLVAVPDDMRRPTDPLDGGVLSVAAIGVGPGWTRATVEAVTMLCEHARVKSDVRIYKSRAPYLPT